MKGQTYVILAIILMIIIAIFAVINVDPVLVNYFFWTGESPLILVILFSVLMGGIITAAVGTVKMFKMQRELASLRKKYEALYTQLEVNNEAKLDTFIKHDSIEQSKSNGNS